MNPSRKLFTLGALLNFTDGRLLTSMGDVYDLTHHIMDDNGVTTIGLLITTDRCREELLRQHPFLGQMDKEKAALTKALDEERDQGGRELAIAKWLTKVEVKYGATHEVASLAR